AGLATGADRSLSRRAAARRGDRVELREQAAELAELPRSQLSFPVVLDLLDDLVDRVGRSATSAGEANALVTLVLPVGLAGQVSELLQLPEQVVERLLGHARVLRELRGTLVLGAGVAPDVHVRRNEIGEAALVQPREHAPAHRLPRDSQQRPDQRRWGGVSRPRGSKAT